MNIDKIIYEEFELLKRKIAGNLQRAGHSDKAVDEMKLTVEGDKIEIEIPDSIKYAETGRGPARGNDSKGAFLRNLKDWIKNEGLSVKDDDELERLARFFRWHINKFGTKQWRQGRRYDIYASAIDEFGERIHEKIAEENIQKILEELW